MKFQSLSQKLSLSALAVCALAFAAQAQAASAISPTHRLQSLPASLAAVTPTAASTLVVDVTNIQSVDELGSPDNTVLTFNVGANTVINSLTWDVSLRANSPSWLSEIQVSFGSTSGTDGVTFSPGFGDDNSGIGSYSGSANLADYGLEFQVGADGILRLEFHEGFYDGANPVDGVWTGGTLTFGITQAVPEPSTYGLMALGLIGVGFIARRRKSA
ncbi:PEP-CTERM sorting domain-containing protein [Paucibacter sp. KBW04]|uniref:PEP-CTERM sorting domain-containing protein n=1 Tax=Paucibacter sp. KBW04 TaxID=2153361 RepID=UPI000F5687F2|nr:PEP-CTERM sorting domain-containing protein [Paucibacter sp. KBW04]RQO57385.1 PEP-CTERM sorting domain-containing protein [Paucibacter sp. KBW04]